MLLNKKKCRSIYILLVVVLFSFFQGYGQHGNPRVNIPIGHSADINVVETSVDGKYIVTGSADKTVIIWDARTGKEIRALLINSEVQDLKISPDSRQVIVAKGSRLGGGLSYSLWDIKTGKLIRELSFYGNTGFAFVPPGNLLLVPGYSVSQKQQNLLSPNALFDKTIISLYDLKNNKVIRTFNLGEAAGDGVPKFPDMQTSLFSYQGNQYFVSVPGKLFAREGEGSVLNVWNINNESKPEWSISLNEQVKKVTTARSGSFFATASKNKVWIWNLGSDKPVDSFTAKAIGGIDHLQFTADGKQLFCYSATGEIEKGKNKRSAESIVQIWEIARHQAISSFQMPPGFNSKNIRFAPDGKYFLLQRENRAAAFDNSGNAMFSLTGYVMDTKRMFFSENSRYLSPRTENAEELSKQMDGLKSLIEQSKGLMDNPEFSAMMDKMFAKPIDSLGKDAKAGKRIIVYLPAFDLATATGFQGAKLYSDLLVKGATMKMTKETLSKDKNILLINNEGRPAAYDDLNELQKDKNASQVIGANMGNSTSMLNSVEPESKLKTLINKSTRDTLSLIYLDSTEWIILSNKGYYKCSKNAAGLLHYVADGDKIVSFEQLDLKYNRPDLVLQALGSKDKALIEAYHKTYTNRLERYGMDINAFGNDYVLPEADFVGRDKIDYNQKTESMQVHVNATTGQSSLKRFNVWVNEVPVFSSKGTRITGDAQHPFDTTFALKLSPGKNKIETAVYNAAGYESYRYPLYVNYIPPATKEFKTWFVGIGVNRYADPQHNTLKYTVDDIRAVVAGLQEKAGRNISVDTLFNNRFTMDNLYAIRKKLAAAGINDRVIFMYSGHGVLGKDGKYYFPTSIMNAKDFSNPAEKAVSYESMEELLDIVPARNKLFLIDACHSGIVDPGAETVLNDSVTTSQIMDDLFTYVGRGTGATIIASSSGQSRSQESMDLKHGFFTQGILDAMKKFNAITVSGLKGYLLNQVPSISNQLQTPTVRSENREADFRIW
ncbi:MAG TPA: caspase family protein [Ferruginibacter sp.]|nr:caspase family protein [Ferruginibacter sp.]